MNRLYLSHQERFKKLINFLIIFGFIITLRYFYIQVLNANEYTTEVSKKIEYTKNIRGERGKIFDRNGVLLASNITKVDLWVNTNKEFDETAIASFFYKNFSIDKITTISLLNSKKTNYLPIKKNIAIPNLRKIKEEAIKTKGLNIDTYSQRFYPYEETCSQLIGYVDYNGEGRSGVELELNNLLKGVEKEEIFIKTIDSKSENKEKEKYNHDLRGNDVYLTIDIELQKILYEEIYNGQVNSSAKSANGILVNPFNGEILAIAGTPSFNPNNYKNYKIESFKNNVISNQYEPGSTIKVIPILTVFQDINSNDISYINCENGEYEIPNTSRIIHDHKPHKELTVDEILIYSSNIGITKISDLIGKYQTYKSLRKFGIGTKTGVELPGEERGEFRELDSWTKLSHLMVNMGQEFSVTNIQLCMIYASIANGGYLLKPQIIKEIHTINNTTFSQVQVIRKVMNEDESKRIIKILEKAVTEGTGTNASISEYSIAGKTGTAEKFIDGKYSEREFVSSFASIFPSSNPRYVCMISVDSPEYNKHWGNMTAAPITKEIFIRIISDNFLYKGNSKTI